MFQLFHTTVLEWVNMYLLVHQFWSKVKYIQYLQHKVEGESFEDLRVECPTV